jgi:hypothetical protein
MSSDFRLAMDHFIKFRAPPQTAVSLAMTFCTWAFLRCCFTRCEIYRHVLRHRIIVPYEAEAENIQSETLVMKA